MRLFVLRHAERAPDDPTFDSPLLPQGHTTAATLAETLTTDPTYPAFTHLYTSPFLRCVQTVAPYCERLNLTSVLRVEPALYEYMRADAGHDSRAWRRTWSIGTHPDLDALIDPDYRPWWPLATLEYGESEAAMRARVTAFRVHLTNVHAPEDNVLMVSHLSAVNALLGRTDDATFPMGGVTELCD